MLICYNAIYYAISAQAFLDMDRSGCTVVDLRDPVDLMFGKIDGAVSIPGKQLEENPERIPRDKPVVLFCYIGLSSETAAQKPADLGYDVAHVEGGYNACKKLLAERQTEEDEDAMSFS